ADRSQLRLEFCVVEAGRPDSTVVRGIVWELDANGKGRVKLPEEFPAGGARRVAPIAAPDRTPDPADGVRRGALDRPQTAYAALDGAVSVVVTPGPKGGSLLTLDLTIADLEPLQLGPVDAYHAADVAALVDRLVTDDSVRSAAARQWAGRNSPRARL